MSVGNMFFSSFRSSRSHNGGLFLPLVTCLKLWILTFHDLVAVLSALSEALSQFHTSSDRRSLKYLVLSRIYEWSDYFLFFRNRQRSGWHFFCLGQYECSLLRHLGECWYLNAMFVCRLDQFKLTIKFYEIQIYKYTKWNPNNWQFLTCTYFTNCSWNWLEKYSTSVLKLEFVQFCLWVGVRVIIPANLSLVCPLFYLQIYRAWNITLGQVWETFNILALEYLPPLSQIFV